MPFKQKHVQETLFQVPGRLKEVLMHKVSVNVLKTWRSWYEIRKGIEQAEEGMLYWEWGIVQNTLSATWGQLSEEMQLWNFISSDFKTFFAAFSCIITVKL